MELSKIEENGSECPGDAAGFEVYPFKCDNCDRKFMYRCQKVNHERIHSEIRQFSCRICGKTFKQRCSVASHMDVHNEHLYKCSRCCFESKRKAGLKKHIIRQNHYCKHAAGKCPEQLDSPWPAPPKEVFDCMLCESKLSNFSSLRMHYNIIHAEAKTKRVKVAEDHNIKKVFLETCHICNNGKQFNSKGTLNRHMKIHLNVKQFKCNICNREFRERFNCKRHEQIHYNRVMPLEQGVNPNVQNGSGLGASKGG